MPPPAYLRRWPGCWLRISCCGSSIGGSAEVCRFELDFGRCGAARARVGGGEARRLHRAHVPSRCATAPSTTGGASVTTLRATLSVSCCEKVHDRFRRGCPVALNMLEYKDFAANQSTHNAQLPWYARSRSIPNAQQREQREEAEEAAADQKDGPLRNRGGEEFAADDRDAGAEAVAEARA